MKDKLTQNTQTTETNLLDTLGLFFFPPTGDEVTLDTLEHALRCHSEQPTEPVVEESIMLHEGGNNQECSA